MDGELPENGEVRDVGNRAIEMIRSNESYADTLVVSNTGGFSLKGADRVLDKNGNLIPELLVWINSTVSDVIKR